MKSELTSTFEVFMTDPAVACQICLQGLLALEKVAEIGVAFVELSAILARLEECTAMAIRAQQQTAEANQKTQEVISQLEAITKALESERERSSRLQFHLLELERSIYGRWSEKLSQAELNQLRLDFYADELATCLLTGVKDVDYSKVTTVTSPRQHPGRKPFAAHLCREEVVLKRYKYQEGDVSMGEKAIETLEYTAGEIWVKRTVRQRSMKKHADGRFKIRIAELPVQTIEKSIARASLLAHIVVSKYIDSMPLYWQIEFFKRGGIEFPSSTIGNWITKVCGLVSSLYKLLGKEFLKAEYFNTDKTTMKVIDKGAKIGQTHVGWYWVYLNHWDKLVFFDYEPTWAGEVPESMLKYYQGYIYADGYKVYEVISKRNGNILVCCIAHLRCKFEELCKNNDKRTGAPLLLMDALVAIEAECREPELNFEQIKAARQERAVPVLDEQESWLRHRSAQNDNDEPRLRVVNYAPNRWDKLKLNVTDGMLQLDNNAAAWAIRTVAFGQDNYMFSGSHEGTGRSAMLYSLTASCELNGVNPMMWLTDVLERLAYLPKGDKYLEQLLPNNWQPKPAIPLLKEIIEN